MVHTSLLCVLLLILWWCLVLLEAHTSLAISKALMTLALASSPGTFIAFSLQYSIPAPIPGLSCVSGHLSREGSSLWSCTWSLLWNSAIGWKGQGLLPSPPILRLREGTPYESESLWDASTYLQRFGGCSGCHVPMYFLSFLAVKWDFFLKHHRSGVAVLKTNSAFSQDSSDCAVLRS